MIEEGKYIYSIVKENEDRRFDPIGINNREVSLVHYKDISAVVSSTPVINFDRLDKKELTRHVATHQQINEILMFAKGGSASGGKDYDVVPMTFGIIAPSVSDVLRILEKAYLQFKAALKNIAGKTEFAVQVWWDPKKILEELTNTNLEIQKLKQKEAEIQRQDFINDIHASLRNLSFDSTSNKLIDDEMIANFSFLMERTKESELDKKMQELGKKYEGRLRFKYIGPMPPYSFVNINLGLGNFELVNKAKEILGLGEEASLEEIKKAYYELAHRYHPDRFQGNEEQMKKIAQAYGILENYCESCDELLGQKSQKYSFKKESVENSLIIK